MQNRALSEIHRFSRTFKGVVLGKSHRGSSPKQQMFESSADLSELSSMSEGNCIIVPLLKNSFDGSGPPSNIKEEWKSPYTIIAP